MTPTCDMEYKVFEYYDVNIFEQMLNSYAQQGYILFKTDFLAVEYSRSKQLGQYSENTAVSSGIRYVACMARKKV